MKLVLSPKYGDTVYDGQVTEIGTVESPKIKMTLSYHWYTNKFLLVKTIKDEVFIEVLHRVDNNQGLWSPKNTVKGSMEIFDVARIDKLKWNRKLKFDSTKMAYVVESFDNGKNYEIWYWLKEK